MFRSRRLRRATSFAVSAAAVLTTTVAATPAHADEPIVDGPLDFTHVSRFVVDGSHQRLLLGGGTSANGILVTDLSGDTEATVGIAAGIDDISLSPDGSTAFAVGSGVAKIFRINLTTTPLTATSFTVPANECPDSVAAVSATVVAFGFDCGTSGVGLLNTTTSAIQANTSYTYFQSPIVRLIPGTPARVVAMSDDDTFSTTAIFGVSGTAPVLQGHTDIQGLVNCEYLEDFAVNPDGSTVLTACGGDDRDREYSLTDFGAVATYPTNVYADATAFSPDGSYVAAGMSSDYGNDVAVFNHSGSLIFAADYTDGTPGPTTDPGALAFSADSSQLYALATDDTVTPSEVYLVTLTAGSAPTAPPVDPPPVVAPPVVTPPTATPPTGRTPYTNGSAPKAVPFATQLTVSAPPRVFVGEPFTLSGTLSTASGVGVPSRPVMVTQTVDGVTTGLGTATTSTTGAFSYPVTPSAVGLVTYTVAFAGEATYYASHQATQVTGARAPAQLSLTVSKVKGKVYAVTAHLTAWGVNRHVLITANKKVIGNGVVNSKGLLTVHFTRKKATTFVAVFTGDKNDYPARATKGLH